MTTGCNRHSTSVSAPDVEGLSTTEQVGPLEAEIGNAIGILSQGAFATIGQVRSDLLGNRDLALPVFQLNRHTYEVVPGPATTWNRRIYQTYADHIFGSKTLKEAISGAKEIRALAQEANILNKPLLESSIAVLRAADTLHRFIDADPDGGAAILADLHIQPEASEFAYCLHQLCEAARVRNKADLAKWSGELYGAAFRLRDVLAWVNLISEWEMDLVNVLMRFERCFENTHQMIQNPAFKQPWKNHMFGRCPGVNSLAAILHNDAFMTEWLLSDFLTTTNSEKSILANRQSELSMTPLLITCRKGVSKIISELSEPLQKMFRTIPITEFESSALNSNLLRYQSENQLGHLISSLQQYGSRQGNPTVTGLMEVLNISQGAWHSSTSAGDRYHPQLIDWSTMLPPKQSDAVLRAHELARSCFANGLKGNIWTLHETIVARQYDCIRGSQLITTLLANVGYSGLHPVRWSAGNLQAKAIATDGHTFTTMEGDTALSFDSLKPPALLAPFETFPLPVHRFQGNDYPKILAFEKGYRSLMGFVSGVILLPQGPPADVQLRVPYYGMKRAMGHEATFR